MSNDESDSLERSSDKSDCPGRSNDKSSSLGRSSDKSDGQPWRVKRQVGQLWKVKRQVEQPWKVKRQVGQSWRVNDKLDSPEELSDNSEVSDMSSDKSDSPENSSDSSGNTDVSNRNSEFHDKAGKNSDSAEMSSFNSDSFEIRNVNSVVTERVNDYSDSPNVSIKETDILDSLNDSSVSLDMSSNSLTGRSAIKLQTNSEKARIVELCVKRMLEKSKIISSRKATMSTNGESSQITYTNLNQASKYPFTDNFQVMEPIVNVIKVTASCEICKLIKCPQSNISIFNFAIGDNRHNYKVMHLTREEKHSGDFLNKANEELDSHRVKSVEYIKTKTEYLTKNIAENVQYSDSLKKHNLQIETSSEENSPITECETVDLIENATDNLTNMISINDLSSINTNLENENNRTVMLDETLGKESAPGEVSKNSQKDSSVQENCIHESQQLIINDRLSKQNQVFRFSATASENKLSGSQVENIEQYQTATEYGKDWITDCSQIDLSFSSLDVLKHVRVVCDSVLDTSHSCINSIIHKAKSTVLTDSTPETNPNTDSQESGMAIVTENTDNQEPSSDSDDGSSSSSYFESKARIPNFYKLFKHLTAEAGTDVTAEQVKDHINPQVVLDIYNGFHELRTEDYGNLDLKEKLIRNGLSSLQNTLLRCHDIVRRSGELLRVEARSFTDLQDLNNDLKELADDAQDCIHEIDRSLTGLRVFKKDYMYYKNSLYNELIKFLTVENSGIFK